MPFDEFFINDEQNRIFSAYATVEVKDKQKEYVPLTTFKKAFYKFMLKGAALNLNHKALTIGKVINGEETYLSDGTKAFLITAQIYPSDPDNPIYDQVWDGIKSGEYKGVSIGGGIPILMPIVKDGEIVNSLTTVPLMEISVVKNPANPLAMILASSMAKSNTMQKPEGVDEDKWADAKRAAHESYPELTEEDDKFWKIVQSIYQNMSKCNTLENKEVEKMDDAKPSEQVQEQTQVVSAVDNLAELKDMVSKMYDMMKSYYTQKVEEAKPEVEAEKPAEEAKPEPVTEEPVEKQEPATEESENQESNETKTEEEPKSGENTKPEESEEVEKSMKKGLPEVIAQTPLVPVTQAGPMKKAVWELELERKQLEDKQFRRW